MGATPSYYTGPLRVYCVGCQTELKPVGDDYEDCPKCFAGFQGVDFPTEYPTNRVAEHEVLMAFNGDSDAIAFREWWGSVGEVAFGNWFKKREGE